VGLASSATLSPAGHLTGSRDLSPQRPDVFTREERRIIQRHRTPEQVQRFLRRLPYNWELHGDTLRSFRQVVRHKTAHCLEAALVAAVILEQHGYPRLWSASSPKMGSIT
jgi:hypothetical protein